MNEKMPSGFMNDRNSRGPLLESVKDGFLYTISLMIIVTIANNFAFGAYIQDNKLVFIDYLIFGICVCIAHYISDKISVYITSNVIMKSIKEKKKLSGSVFLLPWFIEMMFDLGLLLAFGFLSVNVMFDHYFVVILMTFIIRLLNTIIERIINAFTRRSEIDD